MNCIEIEKHAKLDFHIGTYAKIHIIALYCGVCKVNAAVAAQILIDKYDVTHIIVTGVAGAINDKLNIFDTVIATEIAYHDVADGILTQYHPWMESIYFKADSELVDGLIRANAENESVFTGTIVTGEAFIEQDGRDKIIEKHNPQCVDMETASIAHVCYVNEIPFAAIRSMSDTPHESGAEAFDKYCIQAAEKSIRVLCTYLDSI
jgi:adenosylhomocysteine nucleosidase